MDYAIIKLGNKQHRVKHGERLVVDRLPADEGKSFEPIVLLGDATVTATVIAHERGPKILVGKYRKRTGYKRHNGFRAATSRVEIALGPGGAKRAPARAEYALEIDDAPGDESPATTEPASKTESPGTEAAPAASVDVLGIPEGYDGLTVAQINADVKGWSRAEIEASLAYEQAHAARKGALAALEAALAKQEDT